jgi:hypothetical protein
MKWVRGKNKAEIRATRLQKWTLNKKSDRIILFDRNSDIIETQNLFG